MKKTEPIKIDTLINRILSNDTAMSKGLLEARALGAWREVVGQNMADATIKITLREGRLYVMFNSAAARSEFFMRRLEIRQKLNHIAGDNVVKFIDVR